MALINISLPDLSNLVYLTRDEAAQLLRVSVSTVDRYAAAGKLPKLSTPGGSPRFARVDIDLMLKVSGDAVSPDDPATGFDETTGTEATKPDAANASARTARRWDGKRPADMNPPPEYVEKRATGGGRDAVDRFVHDLTGRHKS